MSNKPILQLSIYGAVCLALLLIPAFIDDAFLSTNSRAT